MRLFYKEYGQGDPLIILHGLLGSLGNWHPISQQLAAHYHVYAVDQRNHGHSPHSEEMDYKLMAGDLDEFFREHSIASACVLGHSMGGKTAMQFALSFPEKVEKLIVTDIGPRAYEPAHVQILDAMLTLDLASFQTRRQVEDALLLTVPEQAVRRFLLKNLAHEPSGVFRWKPNLRNIRRNYSTLSAAVNSNRPFARPALFIRGGGSDYICEPDLPEIQRLFPGAKISTVAGAGHWVHAEAPEAFIEALDVFLGLKTRG